jgi:hypothetical protein
MRPAPQPSKIVDSYSSDFGVDLRQRNYVHRIRAHRALPGTDLVRHVYAVSPETNLARRPIS